MNGAFYIGATGLDSQQRALDVIANNIANMNTPAFKKSEVRFSELVGASPEAGQPIRPGIEGSSGGVAIETSSRSLGQGELRETGNPLDVAIGGEGFIELLGSSGEMMLWRGGTLTVNRDGLLAAANGLPLKAMITVPEGASALTIGRDGIVSALVDGEASATEIGKIDIVKVRNLGGLSAVDGGMFRPASEEDVASFEPGEAGAGALVQGSIEASNVELTQEMVALMLTQRAYAANAQVLQAGDQLMAIANGLKR
ncbi:MAG TPA: flagellar hook-basal body complex protein [Allosphingosinicella sp.]